MHEYYSKTKYKKRLKFLSILIGTIVHPFRSRDKGSLSSLLHSSLELYDDLTIQIDYPQSYTVSLFVIQIIGSVMRLISYRCFFALP